ncbi:MAG: biofilm regulation protein phosphatase SiaA [Pseudomonadota bacterium]
MATWGFGLRAKSLLALLLATLLALLPAGLIGWQVLEGVRAHFGEAYARNFTQLNSQNILAPVSRNLALSRRLADSVLTRQWLLDEENPTKRDLFFREAEGYRRDFRDGNYFLISNLSRHYYQNDGKGEQNRSPRYTLDPDSPDDTWFFNTMDGDENFNINVNPDAKLGVTRVWLNVVVREGERKIGLAGTGFDLSGFLEDFITTDEPGVTPMIVSEDGAIQAHPDSSLIAYGATTGAASELHRLDDLLADADQRESLRHTLQQSQRSPKQIHTLRAQLDGREQLLAISYIPALKWYVLSAVDLKAAQVLQGTWLKSAVVAVVVVLAILFLAFGYAVERLVLHPLHRLQQSATALSRGNFEVDLPQPGRDEVGDLSRAFGVMASQIKHHTEELEGKVRDRTHKLENTNREMAATQKKISDSIDYASMIQRALLPDKQLTQVLGPHHFVMWHPRDVVGGDFYLFRAEQDRYLIGVVDCAGHGVPGALMTMLARAAFDDAMNRLGLDSPAALLSHADTALREMLNHSELPRAIATNMDAGLASIDRERGTLRYAGAKISLYWSDGDQIHEIKGGRRPLFDRKVGHYRDTELALHPGCTYYLATDGYLDQAGGELGFGFGDSRFAELLLAHAGLPMEEQAAALEQTIRDYRGEHPQRDDITVLSFRID